SYVVRAGDQVWVVDPGPRDPEHLAELLLRCGADSRPRGVLVTHRHLDHTAGAATLARQLAARSGLEVPLYAADRSAVPGSRALPSTLESDHGTVGHVVHLPGHTSDSVALLLEGGRLLSGDTLLGGSSTVIVPEDGGSLSDYLQSLAILRAMTMDGRIGSIHPGHGPAYETPLEALEAIEQAIAHRHARIEEVRRARTARRPLRARPTAGRTGSRHPGPAPAYEPPLEALEAIEQAIAHRHERIEEVRRARTAGVLTIDRLLRVVYGPDLPEQLEGAARWNL